MDFTFEDSPDTSALTKKLLSGYLSCTKTREMMSRSARDLLILVTQVIRLPLQLQKMIHQVKSSESVGQF